MKKLKILQTPVRFSPYIGGVENHVYYLAKELIKNGLDVKVLCANEPKSNNKKVNEIEVERLNYPFKITNTNITPSFPWRIFKSNYDIIHTHMPTPWTADWSILLAKLMNKKSVITIHNDMDKSSFISKLVTKIYLYTIFQLSLALVDKIIIVNPNWKKSFMVTKKILMRHKDKISIIPNGIDLNIFNANTKLKREKNSLLFVSILDEHHKFKGLDYLLEALVHIKKSISSVKLTIVGEGELKKYYQQKADELGIEKNIKFIGALKQNHLAEYYRKASVFILPSTEIEGFGIVLLEAMACGTPVVTTSVAGTSIDIKKHKTGIVVKPRNSKVLKEAIIKLLSNQNSTIEMGINGSTLVKEKYSWIKISKLINNIYRSI